MKEWPLQFDAKVGMLAPDNSGKCVGMMGIHPSTRVPKPHLEYLLEMATNHGYTNYMKRIGKERIDIFTW